MTEKETKCCCCNRKKERSEQEYKDLINIGKGYVHEHAVYAECGDPLYFIRTQTDKRELCFGLTRGSSFYEYI